MYLGTQAAQRHRSRVVAAMEIGDLLIAPASRLTVRNSDVHHRFRQNSDFYYLTSFLEPDAVAVIHRHDQGATYTLFVLPKCPEREVWDGYRCGVEAAKTEFGADQAFAVDELAEQMPNLLDGVKRVIYPVGDADFEPRFEGWRKALRARVRLGASYPTVSVELGSVVHELRLIKDQHELELMERAGQISVAAHRAAMTAGTPGCSEHAIEGLIEGEFRRGGATRFAYPSIVASGANGCVLHYHENDSTIAEGDTLLIDAGCEYAGYASDITVTWPASGRFLEPQRRVYEAVLRVQTAVVEAVRPGATFKLLNDLACRLLVEEMQTLGLLDAKKDVDDLLEAKAYQAYYMHSIGHWIGMDVHDVGSYGKDRNRPFEPGMVLTVEPGIYIAKDAEDAPEELRGIAVRIEDDIAVTKEGWRNLNHGLPRSVEEIHEFMDATRA
jgi:Xaa-Pro aminopeptidase